MADTDGTTPNGDSQTGADGDKSQSDGGNADTGDKDVVPKKQFLAALKSANEKYDALARDMAELKAAKDAPPPQKEPTRDELLQHVTAGNLTQAQADQIWEAQITKKAATAAVTATAAENARTETERKVNAQLLEYKGLVEDAWTPGTDASDRVRAEFRALVEAGSPANTATELAALKITFGSVVTLKASKSAKPGPSESHSETGGNKPPGKPSDTGDGPPKGLTDREKKHYERQIDNGVYKDWNAVKEERKFARVKA